ncbi:glycosyltransferase family 2 protein [Paraflavitalea speifideaquila]|uniref:glycosyltransferase family 2 protein n=1 Tax=Paraflavitalea speifideaquila TaxID=3076558 RepID=UPI0028E59C7C|nr:glycosyltransferase family 2 protein [Paraflavitalea speifideiaquila]
MKNSPSVAILILNWNTSGYLKRFLPSLLQTTYSNKEIYVIDNFSNDDSIKVLEQHFPSVHIIRMYANKGYASGYNLALSQIQADYFLLVNSDIEVTLGFIEPVIELMEAHDDIAICQPKLRSLDEKQMFEYAGACGGWIDRLGYPFARGRILLTIEPDSGQYDNLAQIFWASGACMFLKSSIYEEIGGFYDYYYMHQEDIDLCWRAQHAGYKIYACPESVVFHIGGGSLSWENHLKTFLTFRNNYILLTRNLPLLQLLPVIILRLLMDLGGSLYFYSKGIGELVKPCSKPNLPISIGLYFIVRSGVIQQMDLKIVTGFLMEQ